jgi:uncharacterized protein (TIGR04206 family)
MVRSSPSAVAALVALGGLPWVALLNAPGDTTFVMAWGLLNTNPWHVLVLPSYLAATQGLGSLPWSLQVWPLSAGVEGGALAGREDVRVTAGLLVLSAVGSLSVWWGFLERGTIGAVPVGGVATAVACWWLYWPRLHRRRGADRQ